MADALLKRLWTHLSELNSDPEHIDPDERLFDEATLILPTYLIDSPELQDQRLLLMRHLASDLMDPRISNHTPEINLLVKLFEGFTWQDVCQFGTSSIPYAQGLSVGEGMTAFNKLMLTLLARATSTPSEAAHAASMIDTMQALVKLWLCTADTGVAVQASELLLSLLRVDCEKLSTGVNRVTGQGLVWRRIFGDRDVYGIFFEACSARSEMGLSRNQRTIAQARLMEWLPRVGAMDWLAISVSRHEDVEKQYGVEGGLLDFAAVHMVDYEGDVLMHRCLVDFYAALLQCQEESVRYGSSRYDTSRLDYLMSKGLHERTMKLYLQPQSVDSMFLYGPAANYLATYASIFRTHFLASPEAARILARLSQALTISPARWSQGESPKHDLHLLASLPRKALLPLTSSPVAQLPSRTTNPEVLHTLGALFHGPVQRTNDPSTSEEAAAARSLYYSYVARNSRFWADIATHADTVALKDLALAAISCITAVITANWSTTPEMSLPSGIATPDTSHLAILTPPSLEYTLPYLLRPAQTFSNLVGGRGDAESAAYKIAAAKYDALRALGARLQEQVRVSPGEGFEEMLETVGRRLAQGPMSREGEVGGRVAALEL